MRNGSSLALDETTALKWRTEMPAQQTGTTSTDQKQQQAGQPRQTPEQSQPRQDTRLARLDSLAFVSPFALLQRFFDDDIFNMMGGLAGRTAPTRRSREATGNAMAFVPKIDVVQRGNELVVCADLPGVKPEDVTVEISDSAITIAGERQEERVDDRAGAYRIERTYGAFFREIPLPEGAITDQAKATFNDGVLEITVPAPPEQVSRGRRLEIAQGKSSNESEAKKTAPRQEGA
jgi:HSP20 family protein